MDNPYSLTNPGLNDSEWKQFWSRNGSWIELATGLNWPLDWIGRWIELAAVSNWPLEKKKKPYVILYY